MGVGVERLLAAGNPFPVPPGHRRLGDRPIQQPPEPRPAVPGEAQERLGGGLTDGDVVRVAGDPLRPEGHHHIGSLLVKDADQMGHQLAAGHLGEPAVGIAQPLVSVREAAEHLPGPPVFLLAHGGQGLAGGGAALGDRPGLPAGGQDQHEPELRVGGMEGDAAGGVGVVVGVREHHR
jgi:hypothetical protein